MVEQYKKLWIEGTYWAKKAASTSNIRKAYLYARRARLYSQWRRALASKMNPDDVLTAQREAALS